MLERIYPGYHAFPLSLEGVRQSIERNGQRWSAEKGGERITTSRSIKSQLEDWKSKQLSAETSHEYIYLVLSSGWVEIIIQLKPVTEH